MPHRCPFCRTRLWSGPWFGGGRFKCPRCGNVFKPTVSWGYFRFLLLILIVLVVVLIASLPDRATWLVVFMAGLGFVLWYLPKIINMQPLELTPSEGVLDPEDAEWEERFEKLQERSRFRQMMAIAVVLLVALVVAVVLRLNDLF